MGQWGSRAFEEFVEVDESASDNVSTPQRCRVLELDPRSPSGLDRTPITVALTPSTTLDSETPKLHDPRSPTVGIDRTPIYSTRPEVTDENNKQLRWRGLQTRRLLENDHDVEEDNEQEVLEEQMALMNVKDTSPDAGNTPPETPASRNMQADLIGHADLSPYPESRSYSRLLETETEKTDKLESTETSRPEDKKVKPASKIPITKKKSPVMNKAEAVCQRSPLATRNIDNHTPKAIIQRKQSKKVALQVKSCQVQSMLPGPHRNFQLLSDKENKY